MTRTDNKVQRARNRHGRMLRGLLFAIFMLFWRFSLADQKASIETGNQTGPEIGQHIPNFRGIDQNGRQQTFESIRGPHGALIVFYRSADW